MSFKAMAWATEQEVTTTSTQSHLLLILASFANEVGECYPSIATIVKKTRLAEKTVRKCLKELLELGLISDTKKTAYFGAKIYQLNLDTPSKSTTPSENAGGGKSTSTPLVDLPQGGGNFTADPLVDLPPNPVIEPVIEPVNNHKSVSTHDENTHQNFENSQNPKSDKPTAKTSSAQKPTSAKKFISTDDLVALGVDSQVAQDFLATRKTKLTQTALNGIIRQADEAGLTLAQAVEFACEMGWQSFKADWYANSQKSHFAPSHANSQAWKQEFSRGQSQWGNGWYGNNDQPPMYQPKQIGASHE
ncbi:hypothetical protein AAX05_01245 [Moraxella bovoculi]|uniref:helix-turn-helix domain-containing protein n=1 Tax=Moraxella bovoculi TaxID=386891 RepID=UPI0006245B0C|nr:helix-turn-helix domain-containing protein [Moraxella bovoculi]AKG09025.1 hypothetical protein AAX05_01245 [Moraxella bovoculi]